ncbi:inositol monophosphatase family protein [Pseudonocardia bannensis]|uniref:Inositol-1-monophosphatase n=1 Tax=Pseudonocardia bannensis TaxID=630973 RepID=A0A848DNQ2_9PSEU|nr:inositol monophosphatase family protein [Pseudonocardia bannensis]NMH94382.1 inositol monophosphatase [Pseudonocardia bannensis]
MTCTLIEPALGVAVTAARAGGRVLRAADRRTLEVWSKDAWVDVSTSADHASQAAMVSLIQGDFPDHTVVGEEDTVPGRDDRHVWYVDGLDGTSNFTHGIPWYCVSVALRCGDEVVAGAVYDPVHDELFTAGAGRGATCNGLPLQVAATDELDRALVATQIQTSDPARIAEFAATFERLLNTCGGVRFPGAPALIMCHIAAGHFAAYCERAMAPWDISAGQLILTESGGRVTDFDGVPIASPARTDVVASNARVHDALLAVLRAR